MTDRLQAKPTAEAPHPAVYALGRDREERERLKRQAVELRSHALFLLDRVDLHEGGTAIDLGCGPLGILDLLSARVGPTGHVVGIDSDPAQVAAAREMAFEAGLRNVEVIHGDARNTGQPRGSFDLVHARTLLVNVVNREEMAAEMSRLARPGGYVAVEEPEPVRISYPKNPAWDRLIAVFEEAFGRQGADLTVGRCLPHILRAAGLVDVGVEVRADVYPPGHTRRTVMPDLVRSLRPKIVDLRLMSENELKELDAEVRRYLDDPDTLVLPHLMFLAWGRKAP